MTTHYEVKWEIDIDADSPEEAAQKALEIQRDPNSIATHFEVRKATYDVLTDTYPVWESIDLLTKDEES